MNRLGELSCENLNNPGQNEFFSVNFSNDISIRYVCIICRGIFKNDVDFATCILLVLFLISLCQFRNRKAGSIDMFISIGDWYILFIILFGAEGCCFESSF